MKRLSLLIIGLLSLTCQAEVWFLPGGIEHETVKFQYHELTDDLVPLLSTLVPTAKIRVIKEGTLLVGGSSSDIESVKELVVVLDRSPEEIAVRVGLFRLGPPSVAQMKWLKYRTQESDGLSFYKAPYSCFSGTVVWGFLTESKVLVPVLKPKTVWGRVNQSSELAYQGSKVSIELTRGGRRPTVRVTSELFPEGRTFPHHPFLVEGFAESADGEKLLLYVYPLGS